jgi:ParB-like chromosome segregation protein Spo0J
MQIESRSIESITPYPQNPRKNQTAVDAVARSIRDYGFRVPIILDKDGVIIAGHTRLLAAKQLGMTEVPVHVAHELTPEQAKALRIADNRLHELSTWDTDLLPVELAELKDLGIDLLTLGWSSEELAEIMAPPGNVGLTDPDDVPEPPKEPVSKPGDLWLLGDPDHGHRLLCGDSTKPEDVDRLMDGEKAALVATDPPYILY